MGGFATPVGTAPTTSKISYLTSLSAGSGGYNGISFNGAIFTAREPRRGINFGVVVAMVVAAAREFCGYDE